MAFVNHNETKIRGADFGGDIIVVVINFLVIVANAACGYKLNFLTYLVVGIDVKQVYCGLPIKFERRRGYYQCLRLAVVEIGLREKFFQYQDARNGLAQSHDIRQNKSAKIFEDIKTLLHRIELVFKRFEFLRQIRNHHIFLVCARNVAKMVAQKFDIHLVWSKDGVVGGGVGILNINAYEAGTEKSSDGKPVTGKPGNEDPALSGPCLGCDKVCENCADVCPNRANAVIRVPGTTQPQILHIDDMCNECGNCTVFCPYQGNPYKDKFTLFSDLKAFTESSNQGFILLDKENRTFRVRFENDITDEEPFSEYCSLNDTVRELIKTVFTDHPYLFRQ